MIIAVFWLTFLDNSISSYYFEQQPLQYSLIINLTGRMIIQLLCQYTQEFMN